MIKKLFSFLLLLTFSFIAFADEGMWLPLLIKRLNYTDMQKAGLKLSAEEIYSVNNSSLKDAIVNFGGFCTGEIVSKDGLILTNHHCGYESIQSHSTVEKDYLTNGFWAMSRKEELPNKGLTVSFLVRMEDVTERVLGATKGVSADKLEERIENVSKRIENEATEGTHYNAEVKSFFEGNEYYLFVYETFKDIRLVGAPPSSIGKFGGETDNWMWPRHTGDFSMFRVYTGPDGKPAEYSEANVPLKPKHFLPVALYGVKDNDYTMILGYPGSTDRYLPSEGVKLIYEETNPARIKIREKRLALMKESMDSEDALRIKYAALYAQIINYYKYFIGQNQGLKRLHIIDKKRQEEQMFREWANADTERKKKYAGIIEEYESIYKDYRKVNKSYVYLEEAGFGTQLTLLAYHFNELYQTLAYGGNKEQIAEAVQGAKKEADENFKNYDLKTDRKIFAALMQMYYQDIPKELHPDIFATVQKKYKGDFNKYAEYVYANSIFADEAKMKAFLANPDMKILDKDPGFKAMSSILNGFRAKAGATLGSVYGRLDDANKKYTKGLMEMKNAKGDKVYPNANFTMRLTYGSVQDYFPRDAVHYNFYTTLDGIIEKEDSTSEEFIVPAKLKELHKKKDFGRYAENNTVPVCFISNNDITGGNSGSPVIDGYGNLVGLAFDGNWEAMSGDIVYEPELQRTISTDIRYVLFIIDKYAGAKHLIEEMQLVESKPAEVKQEVPQQETKKPAEVKGKK